MKRILLTIVLAITAVWAAAGQNITISENIPGDAAAILKPRLEAMLRSAGLVETPLSADAVITDRMETSGSITQLALTVELILSSGEVRESFILKGIGADEADAWLRAMKQFLPRSKATADFLEKLK